MRDMADILNWNSASISSALVRTLILGQKSGILVWPILR